MAAVVGVSDVGAVGASGGRGAAVEAEALEDVLQVRLHRVRGAGEDGGDLVVGFPLGDSVQHPCLAGGELEMRGENAYGFLVVGFGTSCAISHPCH